MEGGINIPRVPAQERDPKVVFSSYPRFINSGNADLAIVAQVAAEDPDTEPKIPHPKILTCINRPGNQLSHGDNPLNICSESLVRNRISPIQTKRGKEAKVYEELEFHQALARFCRVSLFEKNSRPNQAVKATPAGIQIPISNKIVMSTNMMSAIKTILTVTLQNHQLLSALLALLDIEVFRVLTHVIIHR